MPLGLCHGSRQGLAQSRAQHLLIHLPPYCVPSYQERRTRSQPHCLTVQICLLVTRSTQPKRVVLYQMPSISIGGLVRHLETEWQLITTFGCVFVSLMSYRELEYAGS